MDDGRPGAGGRNVGGRRGRAGRGEVRHGTSGGLDADRAVALESCTRRRWRWGISWSSSRAGPRTSRCGPRTRGRPNSRWGGARREPSGSAVSPLPVDAYIRTHPHQRRPSSTWPRSVCSTQSGSCHSTGSTGRVERRRCGARTPALLVDLLELLGDMFACCPESWMNGIKIVSSNSQLSQASFPLHCR